MRQKVKALIANNTLYNADNIYLACHQILMERYPALKVRWSRIYGFRWSHLYGNTELSSFNPVKIRLNQNYGIFIDNAYILSPDELERIIKELKECFSDEPLL